MLTIYTTCRSFDNPHMSIIQKNAIKSWLQLKPKPQILVMGNDSGAKETCRELGVTHIDYVCTSPSGIPAFNSMTQIAENMACFDYLLSVSSDIILFQDTLDVLCDLQGTEFLAGTSRWDATITGPIDFLDPQWSQKIKAHAKRLAFTGGDYFLFSKGTFSDMPPFLYGQGLIDWGLYNFAHAQNKLMDLSEMVQIIHQNHDATKKDKNDITHNLQVAQITGGMCLNQARRYLTSNGIQSRNTVQLRMRDQNNNVFWLLFSDNTWFVLADPSNPTNPQGRYSCQYLVDDAGRRWTYDQNGLAILE